MAGFVARSLDTISALIRGDLRRELPGTDASVFPNVLYVFSKVVAAAVHLVELRAAWIYRQVFASTADGAHIERHAYEYGLARKPASAAAGRILTTGTASQLYPAGIGWLSGSVLFRSVSDAYADADGNLFLQVVAETTGTLTNRAEGDTLTLVDPASFPSAGTTATVLTGGIGGGADRESDEDLRARVLFRKRNPPQGGSYTDYERFALEVPGVRRAWAWPFANGPGTVGVWFLFDGRDDLIPTYADVEAVRASIEARRLIRAGLSVSAPIAQAVDVTVSGLGNDTAETRAAIEASLKRMLLERGRPGVAVEAFVLSRSWIGEAISVALGEDRHVLKVPAADVTFTGGQYPVLGVVTYE